MLAPTPADESLRHAALLGCGLLDTPADPRFDDLTRLAATLTGAPMALVSLVDTNRQWFKSHIGIHVSEMPRDIAFCAHTICQAAPLLVPDAIADERFQHNPLVTGNPHIRFYAGVPLTDANGFRLGALCVLGPEPREITPAQIDTLTILGRQVEELILAHQRAEELKRTQAILRRSESTFRTVVEQLVEGIFLAETDSGRIVDANPAFLDMLGYQTDELATITPFDFIAGEGREEITATIESTKEKIRRVGRCDLGFRKYRRKDGTLLDVHVHVAFIPNDGAGYSCVIVHDVTDQKRYETRLFDYQIELEKANLQLKQLAVTDGLTGVKNRAAFNEKLNEEFDRAHRHNHPLSVLLLDVDHFKTFNDTFGHLAGDQALRIVAQRLQETSRSTDFVARYGGEEFAIILPDTDYAGAMVLAERCRRAIASEKWEKRPVTVSIGASTLTPTMTNVDTLLREADQALYFSKQTGRNRINHGSTPVLMTATIRA